MRAVTIRIIQRACESQLAMPVDSFTNPTGARAVLCQHIGFAYDAYDWDVTTWGKENCERLQAAVLRELTMLGFVW